MINFHLSVGYVCWSILSAVLLILPQEAQGAEKAVPLTVDTPWIVQADAGEPLQRALQDVERDWRKVFGHQPVVLTEPPKAYRGPLIYVGVQGPWLEGLLKEKLTTPETFVLRVAENSKGQKVLLAVGSDTRGAIYAAYALSEELLGVDPWYFWTDHEPEAKQTVEVPDRLDRRWGPPTVKYRGWFLNDEDLLAGFAPDPSGENIISPAMHDRIFETLLRLRGNMIIPGTFTFPDESANDLAHRRGLALSQHHILVVGLNTWRWPEDLPFSYSRHPETMEQCWRKTIEAWKDKEVVWVVGYRGRFDHPFWTDEKGIDTPEQRGAMISRVIARQVEMIRKVQPDAMIITNLWAEGAELYRQKHLKLPPDVVVVWPDDGAGILRDHGEVQAGQGTYYHTAMYNTMANQLSEMVPPDRIYEQIGRFIKTGATEHVLVNVSDIRPVPLSTDCVMKLCFNAQPYQGRSDQENRDAFLLDWSRRQFGEKAASQVAAIYDAYFNIPYMRGERLPNANIANGEETWTTRPQGENALQTHLYSLCAMTIPWLKTGKSSNPDAIARIRNQLGFVKESYPYLKNLSAKASALRETIPANRRDFYQSHVLTPIDIHLYSLVALDGVSQAILAFDDGRKDEAANHMEKASKAMEHLNAALRRAEYGKWKGWFQGECFVGLETNRDLVRTLAAVMRGESLPPVRPTVPIGRPSHRAGKMYRQIYRYQEPYLKNFPLMYPQTPTKQKPAQ